MVFAHYDVIPATQQPFDVHEIEEQYHEITSNAIDDGMLQDALEEVEGEYSIFNIMGAGPSSYPREHNHERGDENLRHRDLRGSLRRGTQYGASRRLY